MNELLAALLADRTNTERFSVYADSLEAIGSPQGQLISLMLAREKTPTRKLYTAQKEQLAKVWLGPDAPQLSAWWRGFVREAHFETMDQLALLDHPLLSLLDTAGLEVPGDAWDECLAALGTRPGWLSVRLNIEAGDEPLPLAPLLDAQSPEVFADKRPFEERDLLVREVLDGVLGFDPGISTLHEVLDALASATSISLVGADDDAPLPPLLSEIDPGVKPPADPQDDYDYDGPTDMYGDIEVPEPEPLAIGVLPEVLPDEPPLAAVEVDELHDAEHEAEPDEPDGLPDDPDHVWAEGPVDPDPDWAEPKEDPDADLDVPLSADLLSTESACAHCDQVAPLRRCVECADLCCAQCARQRLSAVTCLRCAP